MQAQPESVPVQGAAPAQDLRHRARGLGHRPPSHRCWAPGLPPQAACGPGRGAAAPCDCRRRAQTPRPQVPEGVPQAQVGSRQSRSVPERQRGWLQLCPPWFRRPSPPCLLPDHRPSPPAVAEPAQARPSPQLPCSPSNGLLWALPLRSSALLPRPCLLPAGHHRHRGRTPPAPLLAADLPGLQPAGLQGPPPQVQSHGCGRPRSGHRHRSRPRSAGHSHRVRPCRHCQA